MGKRIKRKDIENIKKLLPEAIKRSIRYGRERIRNKYKPVIRSAKVSIGKIKNHDKPKVFGVGNNKTGTTSLKAAMEELGYEVGDQRTAEELIYDWAKRDFKRIIDYCKSAEFFQDVPFSKPYTFVVLDHEFPGSKFILTVRDNPEQWYNSLVKFHSKKWGRDGRIQTREDLQQATYLEKGRPIA